MSTNEPIVSHREVKTGTERGFGVVFAVVFAIIGLWPTVFRFDNPRWWALAIAAGFLAAAYLFPNVLKPLNRLWFKFGLLLHDIVNPIVMGLIFYLAFVPMGLLLRVLGKDLLRLKRDPSTSSYWIVRDPPGPAADSMSKQF